MNKFIIVLLLLFVFVLLKKALGRDKREFNRRGIHKNGTKFDDFGYDEKVII